MFTSGSMRKVCRDAAPGVEIVLHELVDDRLLAGRGDLLPENGLELAVVMPALEISELAADGERAHRGGEVEAEDLDPMESRLIGEV